MREAFHSRLAFTINGASGIALTSRAVHYVSARLTDLCAAAGLRSGWPIDLCAAAGYPRTRRLRRAFVMLLRRHLKRSCFCILGESRILSMQ